MANGPYPSLRGDLRQSASGENIQSVGGHQTGVGSPMQANTVAALYRVGPHKSHPHVEEGQSYRTGCRHTRATMDVDAGAAVDDTPLAHDE